MHYKDLLRTIFGVVDTDTLILTPGQQTTKAIAGAFLSRVDVVNRTVFCKYWQPGFEGEVRNNIWRLQCSLYATPTSYNYSVSDMQRENTLHVNVGLPQGFEAEDHGKYNRTLKAALEDRPQNTFRVDIRQDEGLDDMDLWDTVLTVERVIRHDIEDMYDVYNVEVLKSPILPCGLGVDVLVDNNGAQSGASAIVNAIYNNDGKLQYSPEHCQWRLPGTDYGFTMSNLSTLPWKNDIGLSAAITKLVDFYHIDIYQTKRRDE